MLFQNLIVYVQNQENVAQVQPALEHQVPYRSQRYQFLKQDFPSSLIGLHLKPVWQNQKLDHPQATPLNAMQNLHPPLQ